MASQEIFKSRKGLTLIELTIVLAIIAIVAAILIPTFFTATDRARLRSDVQSARVIQSAMDFFRAERGQAVAGNTMEAMLQNLVTAGFLDDDHAGTQSEGARWEYVSGAGVRVNISNSPDGVHRAYANLTDSDRRFVVGGRSAAN